MSKKGTVTNMNQETEKSRHHFNIVDFFVIIIIIAVVCSVFAREGINSIVSTAKTDTEIEYTLRLEYVNENVVKSINTGDSLKLTSTNDPVGKITAVSTENYEAYTAIGNGTMKKTVFPDYYTMLITVKCEGSNTEESFNLNGNFSIAAGMEMYVYNDKCSFNTRVMSVNESGISDTADE